MSMTVTGSRGMVCASHQRAADAGAEVLRAGGSAVDAAIAGGAVICALLPQAVSIGGDGFMLYRGAADARVYALNATGASPAAADAARYPNGIPERGVDSFSVPGLIGGWGEAHRRFGRMPWKDLFGAAIECAREAPMPRTVANAAEGYRDMLSRDAVATELFYDGGAESGPLRKVMRQPALAASFERLAGDGADAFYKDWGAESLSAFVQREGGAMTAADIRAYAPEWVEPISTAYRDCRVWGFPPNSYGLLMLLQLKAIAGFDMSRFGFSSTERFRALISAAHAALAVGLDRIYDGSPAGPDDEDLCTALSRKMAAAGGEGVSNRGGTATISAVDRDGNLSVNILSVYMLFGSGRIDPGTGIVLQNRMAGFDTAPGKPRSLAPGRRPPHTLNPCIVEKDGKPWIGIVTPGGPGQTLTLTQVISAAVDLGMPLGDVIAGPRWSMDFTGTSILEHGLPPDMSSELGAFGISAVPAPPGSLFFGSVEAVQFLGNGELAGVADQRRDAGAAEV